MTRNSPCATSSVEIGDATSRSARHVEAFPDAFEPKLGSRVNPHACGLRRCAAP